LLLGTGFVAFGLQIFRPALEPFLADAFWWSLVERMRSASTGQLALCALFGALCVGALHGPAPLIVLALGLAQASGNFSLHTLLALLSGSAFGAALGALVTAPAGHRARHFARLNLVFGGAVSVLAFFSVPLWVSVSELVVGKLAMPLHWSTRMPMPELGLRLLVGFGASQFACVLLLSPLVERAAAWLEERRPPSSEPLSTTFAVMPGQEMRSALDGVLARQQQALASMVALTSDGLRRHGDEAEQTLSAGRAELETLLAGPVRKLAISSDTQGLAGAAFAAFQLQHTLERLLETAERMVDARLEQSTSRGWHEERERAEGHEPDVRESSLLGLHRLVFEGIEAARDALRERAPLDLDAARAREIQLNRLEAEARAALLDVERGRHLDDRDLHVLEVVGAYEVSGNHVYRLAEVLGQTSALPSASST
jgi:hypothetical protein